MTNREFVSRIKNGMKALNKDEHVSSRYILRTGKSKAKYLMSQKLREKSLYREDNLYTTIKCFGLKSDNVVECDIVAFRKCRSLMKSKVRLPEMVYSKYGAAVLNVTTVDGETEFIPVTPDQYRLNTKRRFAKFVNKKYYYVHDGYLYLPDSEIESVDITILTLDKKEAVEMSECFNDKDKCKSIWEYEFVCSDKLLEVVLQETLNEVLSTNKQIMEDENPNLDSTQRGKTTV